MKFVENKKKELTLFDEKKKKKNGWDLTKTVRFHS